MPPPLMLDDVWEAWRVAGAAHGVTRIPLSPYGGRVHETLRMIASAACSLPELEAALACWWDSPHVQLARVLGAFASDLPEVLAHLDAGHREAFRGPPAPPHVAPACAHGHTPPCTTMQACTARWLTEARAARAHPHL